MQFLRKGFFVVVLVLAAYGAFQLVPQTYEAVNVYYATDWNERPYGVVGFPSFNAKTGKDFVNGGETAVQQTTGGIMVLPVDASAENKVPAMVILHGSGGAWGGRSVNLAMLLAEHGIAGLAVDTFTARNLRSTDDYLDRLDKAPIYTQMADALSALKALQDHPYIDSEKIGVTGFSLGAGSTMYMMFEPVLEGVMGKDGPRFSAYAMFYGGCSANFDDFRVEGSPLLIMMGGADESMSIERSAWMRDKLIDMGVDVEMVVYEGAGHGWDNPYPQAFKEGAWVTKDCIMRWTETGENIEESSGYSMDSTISAMLAINSCGGPDGYTMGFNSNAYENSNRDLLLFLKKTWGM